MPTTRRAREWGEAGTDSGGGSPFMVQGFALHHELALLQDAGLTTAAALRAATSYAAAATRRSGRFGLVAPGARADLLLVGADPLDDLDVLRRPEGVMVRGTWLGRRDLDHLLGRLSAIQDRTPAIARPAHTGTPERAEVQPLVTQLLSQRAAGFVHPDHQLVELARALAACGFPDLAGHVRAGQAPMPE